MSPTLPPNASFYHSHATAAEAEADGWRFDGTLGRWLAPPHIRDKYKKMEKVTKDLFTHEGLESADTGVLRGLLFKLSMGVETWRGSGSRSPEEMSEGELREAVKRQASALVLACREWSVVGGTHLQQVCSGCGIFPEVGKKFSKCNACLAAMYCSKACQKSHWAIHKVRCAQQQETRAEAAAHGVSADAYQQSGKDIVSWYNSVPDLDNGVMCAAWLHRRESPIILVQGGVNPQVATTTVIPRVQWDRDIPGSILSGGENAGGRNAEHAEHLRQRALFENAVECVLDGGQLRRQLQQKFAMADTDPDKHFMVLMIPGHAGTKDWASAVPRMAFSKPPEQMDEYVAHLAVVGHTVQVDSPRIWCI